MLGSGTRRVRSEVDQTLISGRAGWQDRDPVVLDPRVRGEVGLGARGDYDDALQGASREQRVQDEGAG